MKTFNLKLEAWVVVLIAVAALLLTAMVLAIIAELGTEARVAEEEKELGSLPYMLDFVYVGSKKFGSFRQLMSKC